MSRMKNHQPEKTGHSFFIRCEHCGVPIAEYRGGFLIIKSKHFGEKHINVINVSDLEKIDKGLYLVHDYNIIPIKE